MVFVRFMVEKLGIIWIFFNMARILFFVVWLHYTIGCSCGGTGGVTVADACLFFGNVIY